ncbi:ROK family protein [Intrasporangium sp. DVR]|uniref:ROK family protein n=1 Tax=Intrasporangium sp. DVR TaxID=3127867 RepID=UPI00333E4F50
MRQAVVGIDVGGTRIKSALLSSGGAILGESTSPTPRMLRDVLGQTVREIVASLVAASSSGGGGAAVAAVGVVVPGLVDDDRGIGVWSANLGWRDLDLRALVEGHLDVPVAIGHDVRAGLLGEHRFGAAREVADVLFLPLGTGIAGAMLSQGHLVRGSAWTGEIGHVVVVPDGPACRCGQRGCLEAISSAAAIGRRWSEATGESGDAEHVVRRLNAGDPLAQRIWREAVDALATVTAPVVAAAGTELVLVGGGLVRSGEALLGPFRAQLQQRLGGRTDVGVSAAALGDRSGSLGAASLALDLLSA